MHRLISASLAVGSDVYNTTTSFDVDTYGDITGVHYGFDDLNDPCVDLVTSSGGILDAQRVLHWRSHKLSVRVRRTYCGLDTRKGATLHDTRSVLQCFAMCIVCCLNKHATLVKAQLLNKWYALR